MDLTPTTPTPTPPTPATSPTSSTTPAPPTLMLIAVVQRLLVLAAAASSSIVHFPVYCYTSFRLWVEFYASELVRHLPHVGLWVTPTATSDEESDGKRSARKMYFYGEMWPTHVRVCLLEEEVAIAIVGKGRSESVDLPASRLDAFRATVAANATVELRGDGLLVPERAGEAVELAVNDEIVGWGNASSAAAGAFTPGPTISDAMVEAVVQDHIYQAYTVQCAKSAQLRRLVMRVMDDYFHLATLRSPVRGNVERLHMTLEKAKGDMDAAIESFLKLVAP